MSGHCAFWLAERLAAGTPVILVRIAEARGSTPREAGTVMAVSSEEICGTIGGGRLEHEAIAKARAMIAEGLSSAALDLPLGPAVGQCCGGHVMLSLVRADGAALKALERDEASAAAANDQVVVFGAGHVGRALMSALQALPLRLLWCDQRDDAFIPDTTVATFRGDALQAFEAIEPGAAVMVMTHDHGLDFQITEAALRRGDLAYVGLIGSHTKARRFERWFVARGGDPRRLDDLICPIGEGGQRDKRPEVIAALAAAEILTALAEHQRHTQSGAAAQFSGKARR